MVTTCDIFTFNMYKSLECYYLFIYWRGGIYLQFKSDVSTHLNLPNRFRSVLSAVPDHDQCIAIHQSISQCLCCLSEYKIISPWRLLKSCWPEDGAVEAYG